MAEKQPNIPVAVYSTCYKKSLEPEELLTLGTFQWIQMQVLEDFNDVTILLFQFLLWNDA